jgi:para-aminobenzoate synthetase component I
MDKMKAIEKMNLLGSQSLPFLFIIDFDFKKPLVLSPEEIIHSGIQYRIRHDEAPAFNIPAFEFEKKPVTFSEYQQAFDIVYRELSYGNSYLINLTIPTRINTTLSLEEIFHYSKAPFKLLVPDRFVIFSPESFVRISKGMISTFPMKGTINANIPDAEAIILSDPKEQAEHTTIVDLLRNDLSMVAENVTVKRYRYVEKIETAGGALLQVSSEIAGELKDDYKTQLGNIIFKMLPAGSVTGAPKEKTVEIIRRAENYERGYFTGIFGYFDGKVLESAVSIRFIENTPEGFVYKSGGGITAKSEAGKEYQELLDKVYVPIV